MSAEPERVRGPGPSGAGLLLVALTAALAAARVRAQAPPPGTPSEASPPRVTSDTSARDTLPSGVGRDPIAIATREYQRSGIARPVVEGDFVSFPFGHSQPTLTCTVLRACVIELEAGEVVLSRIAGDTERWEIAPAAAGEDGRTVLIVVKPRDCDITTNLVLATDRRLYDLTLDSPPCKSGATNPQQPYIRHVRFYYPDETVARWAHVRETRSAAQRTAPDILSLNFAYRVKKDRHFPFAPAQVFDDGVRVYIKLPPAARHASAPVLFVLEPDDSKVLVNYSVRGSDTYVTDRLFQRAVLVWGEGGKDREVVIERQDEMADPSHQSSTRTSVPVP